MLFFLLHSAWVRPALLAWRSLDGFLALRAHVAGHARARFGRAALSSNVSAFISLHGTFFLFFGRARSRSLWASVHLPFLFNRCSTLALLACLNASSPHFLALLACINASFLSIPCNG